MIRVLDHDPAWAEVFNGLRGTFEVALRQAGVTVVSIEHVGSTAVPGLAAKPVIDCDIVVREGDVTAASDVLVGLGFEPRGELGIPQRWAFRAPDGFPPTHTYVVVEGSLAHRNHLAVRNLLSRDAGLRMQYSDAKSRAAAAANDMHEYVAGKNWMVQRLLEAAGFSAPERAAIDAQQSPRA